MNKKSVFISIIIILFMVFSLGVGYFLGNKETVSEVEVKKDNEKKLTDEEIDELGKQLFDKTSSFSINNVYIYYSDEKINVDSIKLEDRLNDTLENISLKNVFYNTSVSLSALHSEECFDQVTSNYTCFSYRIYKNVFENTYFNLFNQKIPSFSSFTSDHLDRCVLEGDYLNCYPMDGGTAFDGTLKYINYDKAEYEDNTMYIYSDYIGFLYGLNGDYKAYAYNDIKLTNKIDNTDYSSEIEKYLNDEDNIFQDKDTLFTKFADKTGKYKLTFKQNELGNWYWVQTEKIK